MFYVMSNETVQIPEFKQKYNKHTSCKCVIFTLILGNSGQFWGMAILLLKEPILMQINYLIKQNLDCTCRSELPLMSKNFVFSQ